MQFPEKYMYTKSHEWVNFEDETTALVGLTDYAQKELGDLVFVNLPEAGDEVAVGEAFGDVESVKAVSDVYAPVSGVVDAINEELLDSPEQINNNANEAWLIRVRDITEREEMMNAAAYKAFIDTCK